MRHYGNLLLISSLMIFGGCFVVYGYDDVEPKESGSNGGSGGGSAVVGSSSSSSSNSSSSGGGGSGGVCDPTKLAICRDKDQNCTSTDCLELDWAKRFGNVTYAQLATTVAIDKAENVVVSGNYDGGAASWFYFADIPDATKGVGSSLVKNGFVARLSKTGVANYVHDFQGAIETVTNLDSNGNIIAASTSGNQLQLDQITFDTSGVGTPLSKPITLTGLNKAPNPSANLHVVAITRDDANNIYVLVHNDGGDDTLDFQIQSTNILIKNGAFVLQFDSSFTYKWAKNFASTNKGDIVPTAMKASIVEPKGVWITGTFLNQFDYGGANPFMNQGSSPDMFLLRLDPGSTVDFSQRYSTNDAAADPPPTIMPRAIDIDSKGNPLVAGDILGTTEFTPQVMLGKQSLAFLARVVLATPATPQLRIFDAAGTSGAVHATGISMLGSRIFAVGTYSGPIYLDYPNDTIGVNIGASGPLTSTPFMAVLDEPSFTLKSFASFDGMGEPQDNVSLHVVAYQSGLAIAGGWTKGFDFSTQGDQAGLKTEFPMGEGKNPDILLTHFALPTP